MRKNPKRSERDPLIFFLPRDAKAKKTWRHGIGRFFFRENSGILGLDINITGAHVVVDPDLILHHCINAIGSASSIGCQPRLKHHLEGSRWDMMTQRVES